MFHQLHLTTYALAALAAFGLLGIITLLAMSFRVVVPTNSVHIVQSAHKTVSYGAGQQAGNTYYRWPAWLPIIGIRVIQLPVSIFTVQLNNYAAYDKGRVPFVIDIMAFFRITDSNVAAARVSSFSELEEQLQGILQSACRSILARSEIEEILEGRSTFGELFTKEVDSNLANWGVQSVKQIELMDIRDVQNSNVIQNIMAKKKSFIDRQSRVEVAENSRAAKVAEIEADQAVKLRDQEAMERVALRTAQKEQAVGIAQQQAEQAVKNEARATAEKEMAVLQVQQVRAAEIQRDVQVVNAEQTKRTTIITAEGLQQQVILTAEGDLEAARRNAEAVRARGEANGAAEQAVLMAPVNAQIQLAKEIGENDAYQKYLLSVRAIEKDQAVGTAQAEALKAADIKVIANAGDVVDGVKNAMDLFTSKGGTQMGAMLEAFAQTPTGAAFVSRLKGNGAAGAAATK